MPTFISTIKLTDRGVADIRNTIQRSEQFKATANKFDVEVTNVYWTLGSMDGLIILNAPNEEAATSLMLYLASQGNVETETCRAYDAYEMTAILDKMP